jgi:ATP-dependent RNA helicase DHX57
LNVHAGEPALLKALLLAALYPSVAHITLPPDAVKYSRVASGTVAKEVGAHEWRAKDMRGTRVWVHPASMLFTETRWRSGIVVSFERVETANKNSNRNGNKVYLRDVTEVSGSFLRYIKGLLLMTVINRRFRCTPCYYSEGISPLIMCVVA